MKKILIIAGSVVGLGIILGALAATVGILAAPSADIPTRLDALVKDVGKISGHTIGHGALRQPVKAKGKA